MRSRPIPPTGSRAARTRSRCAWTSPRSPGALASKGLAGARLVSARAVARRGRRARGGLGWRAMLAPERFLDADERVHLNAAWFASRG